MPRNWESYDGYRTRQDAVNAANDLRKSMGDKWDVRVAHKPNDSLPYHVQIRGKHGR